MAAYDLPILATDIQDMTSRKKILVDENKTELVRYKEILRQKVVQVKKAEVDFG